MLRLDFMVFGHVQANCHSKQSISDIVVGVTTPTTKNIVWAEAGRMYYQVVTPRSRGMSLRYFS